METNTTPSVTGRRGPYYPSKALWADAQAARLRAELVREQARWEPASRWRAVKAKAVAMDCIRQDIRRYEALAERFRAAGT